MPQQLVDILASTETQPMDNVTEEQEEQRQYEMVEEDDVVDSILDLMYEEEDIE
jgi:hypothetical protein